jgi:hypothetical protein
MHKLQKVNDVLAGINKMALFPERICKIRKNRKVIKGFNIFLAHLIGVFSFRKVFPRL